MSVDKSLAEPVRDPFPNAFARYLAATRPAFLTVTFAGSLIGLGTAFADGLSIDWARALVAILFALVNPLQVFRTAALSMFDPQLIVLGPSAYVILDLFGIAGYKVFAVAYPAALGVLSAAVGFLIFRRGDLP